MSRSYKRYPKVKQERLTKSDKIILNRRLIHLDVYQFFGVVSISVDYLIWKLGNTDGLGKMLLKIGTNLIIYVRSTQL